MTARTYLQRGQKKTPTYRYQTPPYICRTLLLDQEARLPCERIGDVKTIDLEDATPDASQELWHQLTCTLNED
jgi:hypothetical protein